MALPYQLLIMNLSADPNQIDREEAYINPVIAVALGVALLGEQPGAGAVAGLLLILAGSWLSTGGRLPPPFSNWQARGRRLVRGS